MDRENRVIGRAPRREVRGQNLLHRGVGILCRNSRGEVYVHRRTDTKDVFPGLYDMLVGGVVAAGESYEDAARREVGEELGVGGSPRYLFTHLYDGPRNRSWVAVYEVEWNGPIRHQESEIAWGAWLAWEELLARVDAPAAGAGDAPWEFVPDGLEIFGVYRERFPDGP